MKIVLLNTSIGNGVTTKLLLKLSREFQKKGANSQVWGLYKVDEKYSSFADTKYLLDEAPKTSQYLSLIWILLKKIRCHKPDVLICSLPLANIIGAFCARLAGINKIIVIHHGMFPNYPELFFRVRIEMLLGALGFYSARICVSQSVSDVYEMYLDPFKNRLRVVYNGSDLKESEMIKTKAKEKFGLPNDGFVIISLGRLSHEKNHTFLLDVVASIPTAQLILCGDGDLKDYLHKKATKLGIDSRVHLIGHIDEEHVPDFFRTGDLFAFPSKSEGFGLAVVEAMQAKLPIIASNIPTLQEIVKEGGLLLPLEKSIWKEKIEEFMKSPSLLEEYAQKSILQSKIFSFKNMAKRYYNIASEK